MVNPNSSNQDSSESEPIEFVGIRIEVPSNQPIMLFKRIDSNEYLPIAIGMQEATSIMFILQNVQLPRPLTHDLFVSSLIETHTSLTRVHISQVIDSTYYAELTFQTPTGNFVLSARPSDAVALGVRMPNSVSYSVNPEIFHEGAGIIISDDAPEDEIERFRDFLDNVDPDDFQK